MSTPFQERSWWGARYINIPCLCFIYLV